MVNLQSQQVGRREASKSQNLPYLGTRKQGREGRQTYVDSSRALVYVLHY